MFFQKRTVLSAAKKITSSGRKCYPLASKPRKEALETPFFQAGLVPGTHAVIRALHGRGRDAQASATASALPHVNIVGSAIVLVILSMQRRQAFSL